MVTIPDENSRHEKMSDALERAVNRGIRHAQKDLQDAGGAYDLNELATVLSGDTLKDVDQLVSAGEILEVRDVNNRRQYPKVQFNGDGTVVAGLRIVSESFPSRSPWVILNFLVSPHSGLNGERPIDCLRVGALDKVAAAARSFGEQGY